MIIRTGNTSIVMHSLHLLMGWCNIYHPSDGNRIEWA
jgi:hypothetical protein